MDIMIKTGILTLLVSQVLGRYFLSPSVTVTDITVQTNYSDDQVNDELSANPECRDARYYQHYQVKGCELNQVDSSGCPISFQCVYPKVVSLTQHKVCTYEKKEYKVGERIQLRDKCKVCRCVDETNPRITCRQRECPQLAAVEGKNCHLVYEENKCCPSGYQCEADVSYYGNEVETTVSSCFFDGINYPLGAKIYPSIDPCLVCQCTNSWKGIDDSSCYRQDCVLQMEKKKHLMEKGCIPIYHVFKCCPIEYYCPNILEKAVPDSSFIPYENTSISSEKCFFSGTPYDIGDELPLNNSCISCRCAMPPDFTCIHQYCPRPLNSKNCHTNYDVNQCCPIYECAFKDDTEASFENVSTNDTAEEEAFSETSTYDLKTDEILYNGIDMDNEISHHLLRRKRSESVGTQQQWHVLQQDQAGYDSSEPSAREREGPEGSNENYDEVKIMKPKNSINSAAPIMELDEEAFETVDWTTNVAGCPVPMCADSTCRIGIPPGRRCPTCICKKQKNRQP